MAIASSHSAQETVWVHSVAEVGGQSGCAEWIPWVGRVGSMVEQSGVGREDSVG